jgi:hypothetical protein
MYGSNSSGSEKVLLYPKGDGGLGTENVEHID